MASVRVGRDIWLVWYVEPEIFSARDGMTGQDYAHYPTFGELVNGGCFLFVYCFLQDTIKECLNFQAVQG